MEQNEIVKHIKQQFFVYRNGIIADNLRRAGDTHSVIFGLNIPQLQIIAKKVGKNKEAAIDLWENSSSRESRMIAPMIYPKDEMLFEDACNWINTVENTEIADNLCHKLLRELPFAESLIMEYHDKTRDILRYLSLRLAMNLLILGRLVNINEIHVFAQNEVERNCKMTILLAKDILEETNRK